MQPHVWAIDTPWAKKGTEYNGDIITLGIQDTYIAHDKEAYPKNQKQLGASSLLCFGWIKPVEDKKLTEEEILKKIANYTEVHYKDGTKEIVGETRISAVKLAKLLAEHLK